MTGWHDACSGTWHSVCTPNVPNDTVAHYSGSSLQAAQKCASDLAGRQAVATPEMKECHVHYTLDIYTQTLAWGHILQGHVYCTTIHDAHVDLSNC